MPFPPWLYFCIINQQFTVFSYKSLPGYKDRILENRSTPSAAGTEELGDGHAEEEVGGGEEFYHFFTFRIWYGVLLYLLNRKYKPFIYLFFEPLHNPGIEGAQGRNLLTQNLAWVNQLSCTC